MARLSIDAHIRYSIATDAAALLIGTAILFGLSLIPKIISTLALWLLIAGLAMGLGAHVLVWFLIGIRSLELSDDALILYRGRSLTSRRIERRLVRDVSVTRLLGRRTVVVLLRSKKRARIPEDAFPRETFARFADALYEWSADSSAPRRQ